MWEKFLETMIVWCLPLLLLFKRIHYSPCIAEYDGTDLQCTNRIGNESLTISNNFTVLRTNSFLY